MISPIRSLCFNDDHETFTIVLPSQYRVFRCDPFGMILGREMEEYSLGQVATYDGYRFLALTGSPSPPDFNSKCIKIFDHSTGQICFEHQFNDHILSMKLGDGIVVINTHCRIEIWNTNTKELYNSFEIGLNVHCPIAINPESRVIICSGQDDKKVSICTNIRDRNINRKNCVVEEKGISISLVAYNRSGSLFAVATFGGEKIYIFDSLMVNCITTLDRGNSGDIIQTVDFSPNDNYLASCSKDGEVRIFDVRKTTRGASLLQAPIAKTKLSSVTMPRICWMKNEIIGVTSLEGDFYKLTLKDDNLSVDVSPFLKRTD